MVVGEGELLGALILREDRREQRKHQIALPQHAEFEWGNKMEDERESVKNSERGNEREREKE